MTRILAAAAVAFMLTLASQSTSYAQSCDEPNYYVPPSSAIVSPWAWTVWPVWAPALARAYVSYVSGWSTAKWYDGNNNAVFPPDNFWWRVRVRCYDSALSNGVWCSGMWMPPWIEGGGNPPRPPDAHWRCPASHPVMSATTHVQVAGPAMFGYLTE